MKKQLVTITTIIAAGAMLAGCQSVYNALGTDADSVHAAAVSKVSDYAQKAVDKKIEASKNLSEAGKEKLKAEVAQLKAEILAKIAEIKAKTDAAKAEKAEAKDENE